ncbi:N-acetylmuramoyl-L-alanine amidase [Enterococcus cecorum]|uniref:N-acetylmuramoyl-L-alanine amidase n=1 Tax=Enterococcus cecorum TaxID=44008 RepID=UPI0032C43FFD
MTKKKKRRRLKKKWRYRFSLLGIILLLWLILGPIKGHFLHKQESKEATSVTTVKKKKTSPTRKSMKQTFVKATNHDINLYQDADLNSDVLELVPPGEIFNYQCVKDDFYLVTSNKGNTGYISKNEASKFTKKMYQPIHTLKNAIIVLNPGHGGQDSGASSIDEQYFEKDMTLAMAKVVKKTLEKAGAKVYLTHTSSSKYVYLDDVTKFSMDKNADVFLSIHFDAADVDNQYSGVKTYYYYNKYQNLAQSISHQFDNLPLNNLGIEQGNFEVIRETTQPALLLELGYMNNEKDLAYITSKDYRQKVADDIVKGLKNYFKNN